MVAAVRQQDSEVTDQARLEALEHMLGVMCEYLTGLVEDTREGGALESREARLQLEAFEERRDRALETLNDTQYGPLPVRIGKLERLCEALECSWVYFKGLAEAAGIFEESSGGVVCVE
ncbi:MAG: hypothetical protein HKN84_10860 [Gammaproteobacteria bacterium]|nr:hypothetical protein [Gammaproteobacteria bacterium]